MGAAHRSSLADVTFDIAARIARIFSECSGVWGASGVSSWERERLEEWRGRATLSPQQEAVLRQIEVKVFGEEDDA